MTGLICRWARKNKLIICSCKNTLLLLTFTICLDTENPDCSDGDIQLSGAESPGEGCLEICHLGTWGTVCDHSWTIQNSRVACRQLGMEERGTCMTKLDS